MKKVYKTGKEAKHKVAQGLWLFCLFLLLNASLKAQLNDRDLHVGLGLSNYLTSNGHGAFYSGYLAVSKGKGTIMFGPCLQKRFAQVKGGRLSFTWLLAGRDEDEGGQPSFNETDDGVMQLKFLSYVQYLDQASLSYNRARIETITNPEDTRDWNQVKLSTAEAGMGVELDLKLKYFTIRNFITLSGYYHVNYIQGMYHERCGPALSLGTALYIPKF